MISAKCAGRVTGGSALTSSWVRREAAEEAVGLIVWTGGEVDLVGVAAIAAVADPEGPQPVDDNRLPVGTAQLVEELTSRGIEHVDVTIAEIADQYIAGELAKTGRSQRHAPRRIELPVLGESREHVTA